MTVFFGSGLGGMTGKKKDAKRTSPFQKIQLNPEMRPTKTLADVPFAIINTRYRLA